MTFDMSGVSAVPMVDANQLIERLELDALDGVQRCHSGIGRFWRSLQQEIADQFTESQRRELGRLNTR
jgi:hypothetical protein